MPVIKKKLNFILKKTFQLFSTRNILQWIHFCWNVEASPSPNVISTNNNFDCTIQSSMDKCYQKRPTLQKYVWQWLTLTSDLYKTRLKCYCEVDLNSMSSHTDVCSHKRHSLGHANKHINSYGSHYSSSRNFALHSLQTAGVLHFHVYFSFVHRSFLRFHLNTSW